MCENQICSSCGSDEVSILYDYPDEDTIKMAVVDSAKLGGCCIEEYQPLLHCNNCGIDFGGVLMSTEVELLNEVKNLIHQQKEKLKANGGYMNIFDIVNSERYEVRTHSNMIYYLLNPQSDHSMGNLYFKLFLKNIGFSNMVDENWFKIERETVFSDGRIDFVLACEKMCIAIEMKIDAPDQSEQLKRYEDYCKDKTDELIPFSKKPLCEDYRVCYLTLDRHHPSSQSIKGVNMDKFRLLSFGKHILSWLKDCIENTDTKMQAHSAIKQYSILVAKLVKEESEDLQMVKLLMNKENYIALQTLKEEEVTAKQELFNNFYDSLMKELPKGFELYKDENDDTFCSPDEMFDSNKTVCISYMTDKFYTHKNGMKYNIEVFLEISNKNGGALNIGYALFDKTNDKYMKYPKNLKPILDSLELDINSFKRIDNNYYSLCREYLLSRDEDVYWFRDLTTPVINMFEEDGMENEINNIVAIVKNYLSKIDGLS